MIEQEDLPKSLLGLSIAQEILLWDAKTNTPENGRLQRDETFAALSAVTERLRKNILGRHVAAAPAGNSIQAYENLKNAFAEYRKMGLNLDHLEWLGDTVGRHPEERTKELVEATEAVKNYKTRSITSPECEKWLKMALAGKEQLPARDQKNLTIMHRLWMDEAGVSDEITAAVTTAQTAAKNGLAEARKANDGKGDAELWLPSLKNLFHAVVEKCKILAQKLGFDDHYEVMTRKQNPSLQKSTIDKLIAELTEGLKPLATKILEKQEQERISGNAPKPLTKVAIDIQKKVLQRVRSELLGMDETRHVYADSSGSSAFSCGGYDDCRTAGVFEEENFLRGLDSVIHECGHLSYNMNLPREDKYQPISWYQDEGLHETQSILFERVIGHSREFLDHVSDILQDEMMKAEVRFNPETLGGENLFRVANFVQPGQIRIGADGVTYPAHVIMRHVIEQDLFSGKLAFENLPAEWNMQMKKLLGVVVENDRKGCLQDTHWNNLNIGYFISYLVGIAGAEQLGAAMEDKISLTKLTKEKRIPQAIEWLRENIHRHGSEFSFEETMLRVTGEPFSAKAMLENIKTRNLPEKANGVRATL